MPGGDSVTSGHSAVPAHRPAAAPGLSSITRLVFRVDFGHTEPQHVMPSGGAVIADGENQQIYVTY